MLDLDGTAAVGDAPVLAYLRGVAGDEADDLLARWAGSGEGHPDGYALVAAWAAAHGVPEEVRSAAYAASRSALHAGDLEVRAPDGLLAALERRPADVRCVLVTNAPAEGIGPLLERLGLAATLDGVVGDARKPAGLPAVLEGLVRDADLTADRVLSVGDVWRNDLEPATAIGAATAFVDRFGRGEGAPTFRARTLTDLLPDLERWWRA